MYEDLLIALDAEIERLVTARDLLGTAGGGKVTAATPHKRRGRKPGSKNKPRVAEPTAAVPTTTTEATTATA